MKEFKGRVITAGTYKGECIVSHNGFNTLASCQLAMGLGFSKIKVEDQNNPDLYKQVITGKAVCIPKTIGSTTGGMVIQTVCAKGSNPAAFLFSEEIDSLAASGVILAQIWENSKLIAIDRLGEDFLNSVKTGGQVEILEDGTVKVL